MISIVTGHYGSGKTEFALNLALKKKAEGKRVTICDLDIVNPYFRTSDVKNFLSEKGINVVASEFASSNVDIPVLPSEILSVFADGGTEAVFDVGGDEDGAVALGGFFNYIKNKEYKMYFVINAMRPMTANEDDILELAHKIEETSRLKITDVVNNTNLAYLTEPSHILQNAELIEKCAEKLGTGVTYISGKKEILEKIPQKNKHFELETFMNLPF